MIILRDSIVAKVRDFVVAESEVPTDDPEFTDDVHLFESGYLDSLGVVRLLVFIETAFGAKLDESHLFSEEFTTIDGIAALIEATLPAGAAAPISKPTPEPARPPERKPAGLLSFLKKARLFD